MSSSSIIEDLSSTLSLLNLSSNDKDDDSELSLTSDPLLKFREEFTEYLKKNWQLFRSSSLEHSTTEKSLVVLSPLSVKHSFGRKWTSKAYQSTIVERPQRLLAVSIGIAAALSQFPSHFLLHASQLRGSLMSPHVLHIHGKEWPQELERLCLESLKKLSLGQVETPQEWNSGDIYLVQETIEALEGVIGSLETAIDSIFTPSQPRRAFVAIRPPGHHSHRCAPAGFCLINNAHIAIQYAHMTKDVTHAVILDFDLHHGDGSQDICWMKSGFSDNDDVEKQRAGYPHVAYFSIHDINSFPTEVGYASAENIKNASTCIMNAHDLNIWNVHLKPYSTEEEFYQTYEDKYSVLFQKASEFFQDAKVYHKGNLPFKGLVVISAGFDASEHELKSMQRHHVNVPTSFYAKFSSDATTLANEHTDSRLLSLLEGGYSDSALSTGVFSHLVGLQQQTWSHEWGSESTVKELVKGCKPGWKMPKPLAATAQSKKNTVPRSASSEIKDWSAQVIKMARVMVPEFIINQATPKPAIPISERSLRSHSPVFNEKEKEENPVNDIFQNVKHTSAEVKADYDLLTAFAMKDEDEDVSLDGESFGGSLKEEYEN